MATTAAKKRAPAKKKASNASAPAVAVLPGGDKGLMTLARDLRSWTDFVLGIANTAADLSFRVATARLKNPVHKAAVEKAGGLFRDLREGAGLTLADLGRAINLKDVSLLEQVEGGKVGLPFEIILRLAGVLGRNDPIPVAMKLTRTYNPKLWATLESLGIGRLAVQAGREREFANIYRASDAARDLSDEEFAAALKFVRASFESALVFRAELTKAPTGGGKRHGGRRSGEDDHDAAAGVESAG
ncbi:MAG TPA: helix-turn-helix transcriptional regulator [Burkholderiaceae bacterium]|nr:helix-turn-helix transcriptional regulator [Burkholderiaceae bacterium]